MCRAQEPAAAGAPHLEHAPDTFPVYAIDVSGVTRLEAGELERIVYPFTGETKTGSDIENARKAIQAAYAAKGLEAVVVEIPTQTSELFAQGVVQIDVHEAPVGRVRVVDSRYHALSVVRKQVPSVAEGEPLDLRALQRDIEGANRFPDRSVSPSFRAGQVPGTLDVDLRVDDHLPLHASVEVNNDHSPNTTSLRTTAAARYTNLWQAGHSLSFTYSVAPEKRSESEVYSASYTLPFMSSRWSMMLYGYKSNSNVAALGGTNVLGNGYQIGLRGVYRLPSQGNLQTISFGPDFKNFKQDIFVGGKPAGSAPILYLPVVAEYSFATASENSSFDATLGATFGLRTIKRTNCVVTEFGQPCEQVDQFRDRSANSNENFVHLNLGLNYSRSTKSDIVGVLRINGQFADSPLVTNEQYGVGGFSSIRGYLQSEAVGDSGVNGSIELRSPSLSPMLGKLVDDLRFYAFADGGYAHVRAALPDQTSDFSLVSVGGGVRVRLFDFFTGEVLVGVPLLDGPNSRKGDPRLTFQARGEF